MSDASQKSHVTLQVSRKLREQVIVFGGRAHGRDECSRGRFFSPSVSLGFGERGESMPGSLPEKFQDCIERVLRLAAMTSSMRLQKRNRPTSLPDDLSPRSR